MNNPQAISGRLRRIENPTFDLMLLIKRIEALDSELAQTVNLALQELGDVEELSDLERLEISDFAYGQRSYTRS